MRERLPGWKAAAVDACIAVDVTNGRSAAVPHHRPVFKALRLDMAAVGGPGTVALREGREDDLCSRHIRERADGLHETPAVPAPR